MSRWTSLAAAFVKELAVRGFASRSQETYHEDLRFFLRYLDGAGVAGPADLTLQDLRAYQTHLFERPGLRGPRLSLATQSRCLSVVRTFCRFLCQRGLTLIDPSRGLVMPRVARRLPAVILSTKEVLKFLNAIDTRAPIGIRDRAIFETLYSTGLRVGELVALTPADVDLDQGFLRVRHGKGGKARVVPLGRIAARWIERYLKTARPRASPVAALFLTTRTHQAMNRTLLSQLVRRLAAQAGLKMRVTCHTFRHTCATHLLRARASLRHIQELLGHADPNTTQIYTHVGILDLKRIHQRCHPRSR